MRRTSPRAVFLWMSGAQSLLFSLVFTVNMVYQATVVGLNPLQLVLVGTTLEVAYFLFEVPTGIVADVRSRKLSVLIGFGLIGTGFMVEAIPRFGAVLLAQVLWGIGATFTSGAMEAWIIDEMAATGDDLPTGDLFLRATQAGRVGEHGGASRSCKGLDHIAGDHAVVNPAWPHKKTGPAMNQHA